MDGWVISGGFCNGLCWVHSPKRPRACAGIITHPPRVGGRFRSPQDPLPSAAVDPFTEQTQEAVPVLHWHSTRRTRPAQELSPPPQTPPRGIWGRYRSPQKPVPTVGIPTECPGRFIRRRLRLWILLTLFVACTDTREYGLLHYSQRAASRHVRPVLKDQPGTPKALYGRQRPPRQCFTPPPRADRP
jgi:hypothetical protein